MSDVLKTSLSNGVFHIVLDRPKANAIDLKTSREMGEVFITSEPRMQDTKNRQNSIEVDLAEDGMAELVVKWEELQQDVIYTCGRAYDWAIENGIAKEVARKVLPEGLTKTRLYMNGTLRSWIHYIDLRSANGTQKEHMDVAKACATVIAEVFPIAKSL